MTEKMVSDIVGGFVILGILALIGFCMWCLYVVPEQVMNPKPTRKG